LRRATCRRQSTSAAREPPSPRGPTVGRAPIPTGQSANLGIDNAECSRYLRAALQRVRLRNGWRSDPRRRALPRAGDRLVPDLLVVGVWPPRPPLSSPRHCCSERVGQESLLGIRNSGEPERCRSPVARFARSPIQHCSVSTNGCALCGRSTLRFPRRGCGEWGTRAASGAESPCAARANLGTSWERTAGRRH
jgi:hypothetical protein